MGACPWQLVAESAGFSAADYSPPFLLGGSFFGSQGLRPCNAYALRRAFALVCLKRNAWLCPCKQAKPSRPFRVTQRGSLTPVIPSSARDLLLKYCRYFLRDPSTARLRRSAQDDRGTPAALLRPGGHKKTAPFFHNQIARSKATPLEKRPQFAVCLRLFGER